MAVITTVSAAPAESNLPNKHPFAAETYRRGERRCSLAASELGSRWRLPPRRVNRDGQHRRAKFPASSASGSQGPAGSRPAAVCRRRPFQGRAGDGTPRIIVTAIVLVAATAALALAPQLHLGYPQGGCGPGPGHGGVGYRVAGLLPGIRTASPPHPAERAPAGVRARGTCAIQPVPGVRCQTVAGWAPDDLTVWAAPVASSFGALLFVLAAFLPDRPLRPSGPLLVVGAGVVTTALLLAMVLVPPLARSLPPQVVASLGPGSSGRPDRHLAQLSPQLAGAVLYGLAAVGFLRRSRRSRDEFFGWLALAATLAAASQVNYLLSAMDPQSPVRWRRVPVPLLRGPARWFHPGNLVLLACAVDGSGADGAAANRLRAARWGSARTCVSGA